MARSRKPIPSYLLHKQSGRGRLVWYTHLRERKQKLLPGLFGSNESLAAKARQVRGVTAAIPMADSPPVEVAGSRVSVCPHNQESGIRDWELVEDEPRTTTDPHPPIPNPYEMLTFAPTSSGGSGRR